MVRDENVETAEGRNGGGYQVLSGIGGGKVAGEGATVFRAAFADEGVGLGFRGLIVKDDFCAGGHEHAYGGGANAA